MGASVTFRVVLDITTHAMTVLTQVFALAGRRVLRVIPRVALVALTDFVVMVTLRAALDITTHAMTLAALLLVPMFELLGRRVLRVTPRVALPSQHALLGCPAPKIRHLRARP